MAGEQALAECQLAGYCVDIERGYVYLRTWGVTFAHWDYSSNVEGRDMLVWHSTDCSLDGGVVMAAMKHVLAKAKS